MQNVTIISKKIYEINGKYVMCDFDIAELYGVETKRINEAVKRNQAKFPERYSWVLTDEESKSFLVANCDQKNTETRGGKFKNPRVFTEQGVAMLATILKSKVAVATSIKIMDAFVLMKSYISNAILEQKYFNNLVLNHEERLNLVETAFNSFNERTENNAVFFSGQIYDAYSKIQDICCSAIKSLIIIDSYADSTLLDIIKRINIKVIIITKNNNYITSQDIARYNSQYHNLEVIFNNDYHDRFFIIDNKKVYHCGASVNRIGYKTFAINLMDEKTGQLIISDIRKLI